MRRVRWAAAATEDLRKLRAYYADISEELTQNMVDRVVLATDWLVEWPYAGAELGMSGWRKWTARRTPHVLVYRPASDGIEIGRVRHEREHWLRAP